MLDSEELEDLKGKKFKDLTFNDKCRIMTSVITKEHHNTELAQKLVKIIKNDDHECGRETCHNNCHRHLKGRAFDLLYVYFNLEEENLMSDSDSEEKKITEECEHCGTWISKNFKGDPWDADEYEPGICDPCEGVQRGEY